MSATGMATNDHGPGGDPGAVTIDLPSRIRRALRRRDEAELAVLNPIVLALAKGEVTLDDIETLDAEQATWLVAARAQERGDIAGRRRHREPRRLTRG